MCFDKLQYVHEYIQITKFLVKYKTSIYNFIFSKNIHNSNKLHKKAQTKWIFKLSKIYWNTTYVNASDFLFFSLLRIFNVIKRTKKIKNSQNLLSNQYLSHESVVPQAQKNKCKNWSHELVEVWIFDCVLLTITFILIKTIMNKFKQCYTDNCLMKKNLI